MTDKCVFEVTNLEKTYDGQKNKALKGVSRKFAAGTAVALLGPNGAGKSTFIKLCVGLLSQDCGEIKYHIDVNKDIGYVPEEELNFHYMTGFDFLCFVGALRGLSTTAVENRIAEMHGILKFPDLKLLISSYSKGNKQKILLMSALLHTPRVLILDEPFNGFDPQVVAALKEYFADYVAGGNFILFSSHILDTVSQVCSEIIIINKGGIVYEATADGHDAEKLERLYLELVAGQASEV